MNSTQQGPRSRPQTTLLERISNVRHRRRQNKQRFSGKMRQTDRLRAGRRSSPRRASVYHARAWRPAGYSQTRTVRSTNIAKHMEHQHCGTSIGTRPLRHVALPHNYRLAQKRSLFASEMQYPTICRMGRWSFWSWFDVNRSTFDEDRREKRFLHYPSDLDLWPLAYVTVYI